MLFRSNHGKLIEINKNDFKNDKLYFQKIMSLFEKVSQQTSTNNSEQLMQSILSKL
jgi:hypothetical protein